MLSPTRHNFVLFGYVLYEFTVGHNKKSLPTDGGSAGSTSNVMGLVPERSDDAGGLRPPDDVISRTVGDIFAKPMCPPGDFASETLIEGVLTYVYPLVDVILIGPFSEDNGRFSISLSRKDGQRMRVLKRQEDEDGGLVDHAKSVLTILFPDQRSALSWRQAIESHTARNPVDALPHAPLLAEKKRYIGAALRSISGSGNTHASQEEEGDRRSKSILGMLVIPTAGAPHNLTGFSHTQNAFVFRPVLTVCSNQKH